MKSKKNKMVQDFERRHDTNSWPMDFIVWTGGLTARKYYVLAFGMIITLLLIVFGNSVDNEFTNWDDDVLIVYNNSIRSLDLENLKNIFSFSAGSTYQPLRTLSAAIDYHFWGLNPVGYHIHSIFLHCLSAIFLMLAMIVVLPELLTQTGMTGQGRDETHFTGFVRLAALLTALLFAIHPVNVEPVTWLCCRKYTLLAFFTFLGFYCFVRSHGKTTMRLGYYSFALFSCMSAAMSSPFGVVLPALFFLYDYCRDESNNPLKVLYKRILSYLPFLIAFVALGFVLFKALVGGSSGGADTGHLMGQYRFTFFISLDVLFKYARNLLFPLFLANRYIDHAIYSFFEPYVIISFIVLLVIVFFVVKNWIRGNKFLLFCYGWFFIAWAPASNIIPISTKMADRYIYVAGAGLFLLSVVYALKIMAWLACRGRRGIISGNLFLIIGIIFLMVLAAISFQRNQIWENSVTLWQNCIINEPSDLALNNLGNALVEKGRLDEAVIILERCVRQQENFLKGFDSVYGYLMAKGDIVERDGQFRARSDAMDSNKTSRMNLAGAYAKNDQDEKALLQYNKVLKNYPDYDVAHARVADVHFRLGNLGRAIEHYKFVLGVKPDNIGLLHKLGMAYAKNGNLDDAVEQYLAVLEKEPEHIDTLVELAVTYTSQGRYKDALDVYRRVIILKPVIVNPRFFYSYGVALMHSEMIDKSVEMYKKALEQDPGFIDANYNLGYIHSAVGDFDKAEEYFRKIFETDPDHINGLFNLGVVLMQKGLKQDAVKCFKRIIEIDPTHDQALLALEKLK